LDSKKETLARIVAPHPNKNVVVFWLVFKFQFRAPTLYFAFSTVTNPPGQQGEKVVFIWRRTRVEVRVERRLQQGMKAIINSA